jgi:HicB family
MRRSNFALRVPPTLLAEARKAAESEGVALNQLITLALAEKVSAMRTEEYFEERARRADSARVNRILARVGKGNPPVEGDALPLEFPARKVRKKK